MNYDEWEETVPPEIRGDSLWKVAVYRLALFLVDLGWQDVTKLMKDRRTIGLSDQSYRALVQSVPILKKATFGHGQRPVSIL